MAKSLNSTGFLDIQLYRKDVIGIGAYGSVYKAQCDDLVCAAKIIHPTLITENPAEKSPQGRFRAECEFLSTLRHPNIIQYLGTWQDPDSDLPVLLMELMDESLTHFLQCSKTPIPFHTQVNICHDIALALSFLHSNGIIHRDLSSNNVLMIGDSRAKVTDFGMAKLTELNSNAARISYSLCPGTDVYMPPEAVKEKPKYTQKIDCFSFGVIMIQILTQKLPSPGNRVKTVIIGGRELLEPQSEFTRREEHIKMVNPTHPLLLIACNCIKDDEMDRPSAKQLCVMVRKLKSDKSYSEREDKNLIKRFSENEEEIRKLKSELDIRDTSIREKDSRIQMLEDIISSKSTSKEIEIRLLEERLNEAQKVNLELIRENLRTLSPTNPGSHKFNNEVEDTSKYIISWRRGSEASQVMNRSSDAVVCGNFVYFRPSTNQDLCVYNWQTDTWLVLPPCPTTYCTLANVRNTLVVIGGFQEDGNKTNKLYNLSIANKQYSWAERYPPMPTKRDSTIAACYGNYLVVVGGVGKSYLRTVEVLDADSKQWFVGASLPSEMFSGSATICGDQLYVLGGWVEFSTITYSILTCSIGALVNSCRKQVLQHEQEIQEGTEDPVWAYGTALPVTKCTCISFQDQLLVVGGQDKLGHPTKKILMYEVASKSWKEFGDCEEARSQCYVAVLPSNEVMVVGGFTGKHFTGETKTVEIATIKPS